jgi:hypothetical protein
MGMAMNEKEEGVMKEERKERKERGRTNGQLLSLTGAVSRSWLTMLLLACERRACMSSGLRTRGFITARSTRCPFFLGGLSPITTDLHR